VEEDSIEVELVVPMVELDDSVVVTVKPVVPVVELVVVVIELEKSIVTELV